MAAIIAQLTRAARRKRSRRTYGTSKCLYSLDPFDRNGFNPILHNRFLRLVLESSIFGQIVNFRYCFDKLRWEEHVRRIQLEDEIIQQTWREHQVGP